MGITVTVHLTNLPIKCTVTVIRHAVARCGGVDPGGGVDCCRHVPRGDGDNDWGETEERAMTAPRRNFAFPRRNSPELCINRSHPDKREGAGNAGCPLHP
jgi:hypothetical protein